MIKILAVDDHPLMREGIIAVVGGQPDMVVMWEAGNGVEAIELYRLHHPGIVLMDLRMPVMDGVTAIEDICAEFPAAKVLVLTTYRGDVAALRALQAGAVGYLLKDTLRLDLIDTIREVYAGKHHIPLEVSAKIAENSWKEQLTVREVTVLDSLANGFSNRLVASELCISEETVKAHLKSIFSKLGAKDRTHAVTIGMRRGIIGP